MNADHAPARERRRFAVVARELLTASRFAIVGLAATAVHVTAVWVILRTTGIPVYLATFCAYLIAFSVSFVGHYFWTFGAPGSPLRSLGRFFLISLAGFGTNLVVLTVLLHSHLFSQSTCAVVAAMAVPVVTYCASRLWGFRKHAPRPLDAL
jgi:putative flippase GtrA